MTSNSKIPLVSSDFNSKFNAPFWEHTELGKVSLWPEHLIFGLNLILKSSQPMAICWGNTKHFFYNKAFLAANLSPDTNFDTFGLPLDKAPLHPEIKTQILLCFNGEQPETTADLTFNNVKQKPSYWSFAFSPLCSNPETISGVLIQALNKTPVIKAKAKSEHLLKRLNNTIRQAPTGVLIISAKTQNIEIINRKFKQLLPAKVTDLIDQPFTKALPHCNFDLKSEIVKLLQTGTGFQANEIQVKNTFDWPNEIRYFNILGEAIYNEEQEITGAIIASTEVTETIIAKQKVSKSEYRFKSLIDNSPIPIALFSGPDHVITMANKTMIHDIWRKTEKDIINKPLVDVFPELKAQKYPELLDKVYKTGIPHKEKESKALIEGNDGTKAFYFDFEYSPIFESDNKISGVMTTSINVTENVISRKKIEKTEARLRIATEAAKLATWELDLKSSKISHSKRLAVIFGYPEDKKLTHEAIRKHVNRKDLKDILLPAFEKGLKTGSYFSEVKAYKDNGEQLWIRKQGKVLYAEDGQPEKIIGTLRDVTSERNNQQRLIENEQKFRLLADSMPQKVWITDKEGNVNYFNKTVYDFTGFKLDKFNPENWLDFVHPDDHKENIRLWEHAVNTGEDYLCEHRFRRFDGQYRWQLSRAIAQRDEKGNIQRWVGTSTDIQDQKMFLKELERQVTERTKLLAETNSKLENSIEELQRMNEELQSFAYISSHDLQEPLRKIQIFASRIQDVEKDNLSETGKDYFNRMQKSASRMQALIKDLLAYSRTNTSVRAYEETDLNDIINEVKADLKELLQDKQVTLEVDSLCSVEIIPFQFIQLFSNLISNAIKFSRTDIPPVIKIESIIDKGAKFNIEELNTEEDYCHIKVSDNGIGFNPKYSEQIFEVFERLHTRTTYEGTGIGLAIVKKIVENHEGYIFASSKEQQGATFNIYIPINKSM
ncbi:PAS domain S-box protein [Formosa sp. S-31]|uniref:PAS domain-containing sensor histidine kinase n=1 Tax=Formosa sp. S-31 TaxID=2790949 RepID=UPI003EBA1AA5